MDRIRIRGGRPLDGTIAISGAKNAALPLMAAALLTEERLALDNVPALADIETMAVLLGQHGAETTVAADAGGRTMTLHARTIRDITAPYDLVRKMRASILVLGPLVARVGEARVSLPGGCAIGTRPVDLHLKGLALLGAEIVLREGYVEARAPHGLKGARVSFPMVSVGATENLLMAAALADGETILANAACEPEVSDLAHCLVAMGTAIEGIGTGTLRITGRKHLRGARYAVLPDRIETGTYAMAAAITGGDIVLAGARLDDLTAVADKLVEAGVAIERTADGFRARRRRGASLAAVDVTTEPYPGFPTDLQAQFMALMATASGASRITETIFENRFMHVPELARMGADVQVQGATAFVRGVARLKGAPVMATDLRASVSLVLAGLAAEGETIVNRVYHLDRGYERLEAKLAACGADIERIGG
ncbi:MAG: UDP-N-acetylglucosamine 1-carboxyvinyltransferase [Alphaproteobacteria bacterium]|nr:UDP-N-acetylglucosamine 1-carboxyvinyltransferase [Alphaproteobacteria bacterium]